MRISAACIRCLVDKQEYTISNMPDEEKKSAYMKEVLRIIGNSPEEDTAPSLLSSIQKAYKAYFGEAPDYSDTKHIFNQKMLQIEDDVRQTIRHSEDKLAAAISFARTGNYIDLGAMQEIQADVLNALLSEAEKQTVDPQTLKSFRKELATAKNLVYLLDNCGEIVMDKLLMEELMTEYPNLLIDAVVRGMPVLNDVTMEDALEVGLTDFISVTGNGTDIAGTSLEHINAETTELLENADIILSKGQGNFETLHGCGKNIYYLFLCKCDWFVKRFQLTKNEGVFLHESAFSHVGTRKER